MSRCSNSIHCHRDPACEDCTCPGRPDSNEPEAITFAGPEPLSIPAWLACSTMAALCVLAIVGAGALRGHFLP